MAMPVFLRKAQPTQREKEIACEHGALPRKLTLRRRNIAIHFAISSSSRRLRFFLPGSRGLCNEAKMISIKICCGDLSRSSYIWASPQVRALLSIYGLSGVVRSWIALHAIRQSQTINRKFIIHAVPSCRHITILCWKMRACRKRPVCEQPKTGSPARHQKGLWARVAPVERMLVKELHRELRMAVSLSGAMPSKPGKNPSTRLAATEAF